MTMKKILYLFLIALVGASCHRANIAERVAISEPIMPIRMTSDTMHVVLTDYVPALYGDTNKWEGLHWMGAEQLECINLIGTARVPREMDIVNRDRTIHALSFYNDEDAFSIVVLPAKPVRQSLVSLGYGNDKLRVGFVDTVINPTLMAMVQNTPL